MLYEVVPDAGRLGLSALGVQKESVVALHKGTSFGARWRGDFWQGCHKINTEVAALSGLFWFYIESLVEFV
ncbi:MAG: hypothetical protein COC05_04310 [Gammaproteobacteria bacterium]|nr:MAG: hypothetical protein COC05_04310 [Gammaproteobacteria bacterium]